METITIDDLYDYPIAINNVDFKNATGRDLMSEVKGDDKGSAVRNFLNTIHSHIYDYLIYNVGRQSIKSRIIEAYRNELEKPLKRALILQAKYLLSNGNIGMWNGAIISVNGSSDIKDIQDILQRIICPEALNLLLGTEPCILYAGKGG